MITLRVGGVEKEFSEEEITSILEEHFKKTAVAERNIIRAKKPTEGVPFEVNPSTIDRNLFQTSREDCRQERLRRYILDAFEYADKYPKKYAMPFKTFRPEKDWESKRIDEIIKLANKLGDHMTDWVEYAFELAQRIENGESWEDICNKPDSAKWCRLIEGKNGYPCFVGGSRGNTHNCSAYNFVGVTYNSIWMIRYTVPSVVIYE